ncbi:hypothetical protein [Nostoc sp. WHI]|uniref:hypothetical protein n=1 Tax=Nostoc sp. WHI TaxID=2650611 RepID=UPI0018C69FB4|nr:hypothetical protein [Nostoc sp. WHI]MBG1266762.1 hypothetical protein [Nostoc sp. WHI]
MSELTGEDKGYFFGNTRILISSVIAGASSSLLAIILLSFIAEPYWILSGLWVLLLISGVLIFAQSHSIWEKVYLFSTALFSSLFTSFVFKSLQISNPFKMGLSGILVVFLLVLLGGLFVVIKIAFFQLFYKLLSRF